MTTRTVVSSWRVAWQMEEDVFVTLRGHTRRVTAVKFSSVVPFHVVSISEDRTFMVWTRVCLV